MPSNRSVKNNPGAIAFTRIPNSPTSFASRRVRPRIAALAVAYGTPVTGLALLPPIDEKVTIDPPPAFFICGITARAQLNVPFTFTSKTKSKSSSEISSRSLGVPSEPPAAAIKTSTLPSAFANSFTAASTDLESRTSTFCPAAIPPVAVSSETRV